MEEINSIEEKDNESSSDLFYFDKVRASLIKNGHTAPPF